MKLLMPVILYGNPTSMKKVCFHKKYRPKIDRKIFEISALLSRKSGELETSKWCTTAGLALA